MMKCRGYLPTRGVIWIMLFTCTFILYMVRVNMSIIIIAMVEPIKDADQKEVEPECKANANSSLLKLPEPSTTHLKIQKDMGPRYPWDSNMQGLVLGAYFWGFTITGIPGGLLAERFGPTKIIMISFLAAGALTLLGPVAAAWDAGALIVTRFFIGLFGGVVYPSLHCLVSKWAPPEEKGKFISALMGGALGTVATWPMLGWIMEKWGWIWAFYSNGAIVLIWCVLWIFLVSDDPEVHPRISESEKKFIMDSLGDSVSKQKRVPPYLRMAASIPFWALVILHFGNLWGLFFLMTAAPTFLSTVLGFNLKNTGFLSALPYLARLILGFIFGSIGDFIKKRKLLTSTKIRKTFLMCSHIIPGILLACLTLAKCDVIWAVALMTLSLGFNGASCLTNLQNSQDLAPNFAGTIYGVINCIGSTSGFISPLIVGMLTHENNGMHEWSIIFLIGAAVYIGSAFIFAIVGTAEIQPWNEITKTTVKGIENSAYDSTGDKQVGRSENTKL